MIQPPKVVNDHQDYKFHLYCRDSSRLAIEFSLGDDVSHVEKENDEKFIYLIVLQETESSFMDRFIYLVSISVKK